MLIENIPTETFHRMVDDLKADGWTLVEEYDNMDAWIDYGRLKFEKGGLAVVCEWTNWDEGSVEAPPDILRALARPYGLR